jgi:hypothetical protein
VLGGLGAGQREALAAALEPLLAELFEQVRSEYVLCRLCDRGACVGGGRFCPVGRAARAAGEEAEGERP